MAATKKQPKRKTPTTERLKRGRDWHAWAWKTDAGHFHLYALGSDPRLNPRPAPEVYVCGPVTGGHWVRVKFVEVLPSKRGG